MLKLVNALLWSTKLLLAVVTHDLAVGFVLLFNKINRWKRWLSLVKNGLSLCLNTVIYFHLRKIQKKNSSFVNLNAVVAKLLLIMQMANWFLVPTNLSSVKNCLPSY